jgi:hypothetical protein
MEMDKDIEDAVGRLRQVVKNELHVGEEFMVDEWSQSILGDDAGRSLALAGGGTHRLHEAVMAELANGVSAEELAHRIDIEWNAREKEKHLFGTIREVLEQRINGGEVADGTHESDEASDDDRIFEESVRAALMKAITAAFRDDVILVVVPADAVGGKERQLNKALTHLASEFQVMVARARGRGRS